MKGRAHLGAAIISSRDIYAFLPIDVWYFNVNVD